MSSYYQKLFKIWCETRNLDVKKHQVEGIDWVMKRELEPTLGPPGGFICDEMGLGKTILTIASIILHPDCQEQRTLIVLPKSLLEQWSKAIYSLLKVTPFIYHGSIVKGTSDEILKAQKIVLTTYGMISVRKPKSDGIINKEYKCRLWSYKWNRVIYDEAHYLRNSKTGVFKGAKKIKADIKWMVTGTPVNNRPKDFYNQCVIQGVSSCFSCRVKEIRKVIDDIVLKRTKKEAGIIMPEIKEHTIEVEWKSKQEERFVKNIHSLMSFVPVTTQNVDNVIHNLGVMTGRGIAWLMLMRQSCVLPFMAQKALQKRALQCGYDASPISNKLTNSKLDCVVNTISKNKQNGKGKLVFCMFRQEIEYIKNQLKNKKITYAIINGSSTKKQRKMAIQNKLSDETKKILIKKMKNSHTAVLNIINEYLMPQVLIAQIQTCCEGLNLQHFSEVYFTTPHWNPAVEDQAIARAHRIGQKNKVSVYRFITKFEEPDKDDTIRQISKFKVSMSLDEYCIAVQKKKREKAKSCGL